jgi:iron complex outermembrane receptor protein
MKKILFLNLFILVLFTGSIFAQNKIKDSSKYVTDEIIITGTRTLQKIIDIPFSVYRLSQSDFKFDRNVGINDILGGIPGLFTQSRYGNHDVRISIRGFGSRSNSGIRGVRMLMDDIPESEPDGQTRIEAIDFNTIGSIEVVKGNSSSLYTNSPGGVINFKSDITFPKSFVSLFNEFGEFQLRQNGLKIGTLSNDFRFLTTYTYRNYNGYRPHSQEYQNILNTIAQSYLSNNTTLSVYLNAVNGIIKLPGSLSKSEFARDPYMANSTDVSRDAKRITRKGRLGIRFNTMFGKNNNNDVEVMGYGAIKDFDRTAKTYRIFARYGIGGTARYTNRMSFDKIDNEFSVGTDLYYQTGPISEYNNINGVKGDVLLGQTDETISNMGVYFQDQVFLMQTRMNILLTGRYDKVAFQSNDLLFAASNANRSYEKFTPKLAVNFKITPSIAVFTSFGFGFDTPAFNELENYPFSSDHGKGAINPDLKPQKSANFEVGLKGNVISRKSTFLNNLLFDVTFFNLKIEDEIIPFVVDNTAYYRNAGKSTRTGLELGFTANIVKGLKLKSAYTFSNFKYDEYIARTINATGDTITDKQFSGNYAPSVPKHNFSVDLSYAYDFSQNFSAFIKGNYLYIDKMFADDANTENAESYILLTTMAGLEFGYDNISVQLSGGLNNITNKKYSAFININDSGNRFYEAGAPKNFFAGLNIGYRLK